MSDDWLTCPDLEKNSKYKKFHADIQACLQRFEKAQDWADLIEKINRLQSALNDYPQFTVLPERIPLSRTLARCLNPNLVIGIHRKALETLELIFKRIGREQLSKDLPLYTFGLFTLFPVAAIATKPQIMRLYESYFLPLGVTALESCLGGLIASVLPAVHKEEDSEMYRRAVQFLNNLLSLMASEGRAKHFYNAVWSCIWKSATLRSPGFNYLRERLPRAKHSRTACASDVTDDMIGGDAQLVSLAIQASLQDSSEATQRAGLDCLISHFLLHEEGVFSSADFVTLMSVCLAMLTHNQLSTLRRVFIWIYGGDEVSEEYFVDHSREIMGFALADLLEGNCPGITPTHAMDIMLTLLHRPKAEAHFTTLLPSLIPRIMCIVVEQRDMQDKISVKRVLDVVPLSMFVQHTLSVTTEFIKNVHGISPHELSVLRSFYDMIGGLDHTLFTINDIDLYTNTLQELALLLKTIAQEYESLDATQFTQYTQKTLEIVCVLYTAVRGLLNAPQSPENPHPTVIITQHFQNYVEGLLASCFHQQPITGWFGKANVPSEGFVISPQLRCLVPSHVPEPSMLAAMPQPCNVGEGPDRINLFLSSVTMMMGLVQHTDLEGLLTFEERQISTTSSTASVSSFCANDVPSWVHQLVGIVMNADCELCVHATQLLIDIVVDPSTRVLKSSLRNHIIFRTSLFHSLVCRLWRMLDVEHVMFFPAIGTQLSRIFSLPDEDGATGSHTHFGRLCSGILCADITQNRNKGCARFTFLWTALRDSFVTDVNKVLGASLLLMIDNLRSEVPTTRLMGQSWLALGVDHLQFVVETLLELMRDGNSIDRKRTEYVLNALVSMVEAVPDAFVRQLFSVNPSALSMKHFEAIVHQPVNGMMTEAATSQTSSKMTSLFALVVDLCFHLINQEATIHDDESALAIRCVVLLRTIVRAACGASSSRVASSVSVVTLATICSTRFDTVLGHLQHSISRLHAVMQYELLELMQSMMEHLEQCYRAHERGSWITPGTDMLNMNGIDKVGNLINTHIVGNARFGQTFTKGLVAAISMDSNLELCAYDFVTLWQRAITTALPFMHSHICTLSKSFASAYLSVLEDQRKTWVSTDVRTLRVVDICAKGIHELVEYLFAERTTMQAEYMQQTLVTNPTVPYLMNPTTRVVDTPLQHAQSFLLNEVMPQMLKIVLEWYTVVHRSAPNSSSSSRTAAARFSKADEPLIVSYQQAKSAVDDTFRALLDDTLQLSSTNFFTALMSVWVSRRTFGIELFGHEEQDRAIVGLINALPGLTPDIVIERFADLLSHNRAERRSRRPPVAPIDLLREIAPAHFMSVYIEHCAMTDRLRDCFEKLLTTIADDMDKSRDVGHHAFTYLMMLRLFDHAATKVCANKLSFVDEKKVRRQIGDILLFVVANTCREVDPLPIQDLASGVVATPDSHATTLLLLDEILQKICESGFMFREIERVSSIFSNAMQGPMNTVLRLHSLQDVASQTIMIRIRNMGRIRTVLALLYTFLTRMPPQIPRRIGRDVMELLNDGNFFKVDRLAMSMWRDALTSLLRTEPSHLEALLASIRLPETFLMLQTAPRKGDAVHRARQLKRLGFALFCTQLKDGATMGIILQKLTESIKHFRSHMDGTVVRYALFVFRVLMTRAPRHSLGAFWPIVISELIHIFAVSTGKGRDKDLVLEALKVVDFAMCVVPEEFTVFRWIFFNSGDSGSATTFTPLISAMARKLSRETPSTPALLEVGYEEDAANAGGPGAANRPVISFPERCYDDLLDVASIVNALQHANEGTDVARVADPSRFDQRYVDWLLIGDFIQKGMPLDDTAFVTQRSRSYVSRGAASFRSQATTARAGHLDPAQPYLSVHHEIAGEAAGAFVVDSLEDAASDLGPRTAAMTGGVGGDIADMQSSSRSDGPREGSSENNNDDE
eukprot:PhM_4_TR16720/c0_g2_i1/m.83350